MRIDENSMLFWFPKIRDLDIPQPRTVFYRIPERVLGEIVELNMESLDMAAVGRAAAKIGFPLFLRTDQASNKHSWDKASFVVSPRKLRDNLFEVISHNLCAGFFGLPFKALVFREFIPMASRFTAFSGNMPVAPERRYMIRDGEVIKHFPYWPPDAIRNPSVENWGRLLEEMNRETPEEVELLTRCSREVGNVLNGFWSVDFCLARDGRWVLIDCNVGERSWQPDGEG